MANKKLLLRRGTSTEHESFRGDVGEITYVTDTKELRIHDGETDGGTPVGATDQVSAGTLTNNINVADGSGGFTSTAWQITSNTLTMSGHVIPSQNNAYDIGSAENKIRDLYVSDATIYFGAPDETNKDNFSTLSIDRTNPLDPKLKFRGKEINTYDVASDEDISSEGISNAGNKIMTPAKVKGLIDQSVAAISGGMRYRGQINPAAPGESFINAIEGDLFVASTLGSLDGVSFDKGDHLIVNSAIGGTLTGVSAKFDKLDTVDKVTAVNGQTGAVTINANTLGLHPVATSGDYDTLTNKPEIGTAAALNSGTEAGNLVQITNENGTIGLPAIDGSRLTGLSSGSTNAYTLINTNAGNGYSIADPGKGTLTVKYVYDGDADLQLPTASADNKGGVIIVINDTIRTDVLITCLNSSHKIISANQTITAANYTALQPNSTTEFISDGVSWNLTSQDTYSEFKRYYYRPRSTSEANLITIDKEGEYIIYFAPSTAQGLTFTMPTIPAGIYPTVTFVNPNSGSAPVTITGSNSDEFYFRNGTYEISSEAVTSFTMPARSIRRFIKNDRLNKWYSTDEHELASATDVAISNLTNGQFLQYDGSNWVNTTLGTASALDVGTNANKVVQLDGTGRLPAVDGSQLTNLPSAASEPSQITITEFVNGDRVYIDSYSGYKHYLIDTPSENDLTTCFLPYPQSAPLGLNITVKNIGTTNLKLQRRSGSLNGEVAITLTPGETVVAVLDNNTSDNGNWSTW